MDAVEASSAAGSGGGSQWVIPRLVTRWRITRATRRLYRTLQSWEQETTKSQAR